jgi:hypothetical protein
MRWALLLTAGASLVAACRGGDAAATAQPATPVAAVVESVVPRPPLTIDTLEGPLLEIWPVAVDRSRQADETRRLVTNLQADLALLPGFISATVLASGDGSTLVLAVAWDDSSSAVSGDTMLAGWLRIPSDTALRRKQDGTLTPRVVVRRATGTPPTLFDGATVQFTRYVMKSGHSFGALASLADSNLAMRVLQDTAAQGGVLLAGADSGALYMLLQARTATALDPGVSDATTSLPFWAPFAAREQLLLAVVAVVTRP